MDSDGPSCAGCPNGCQLFGSPVLTGAVDDESKLKDVGFKFQVTDVKKPLLSVRRINEGGNTVQFGPRDQDNFIFNPNTQDKVMLRRQGGVYLLDAMMPDGSWTEITVDSGAADNVCPLGWGQCFGMQTLQDRQRINFVGPNGMQIQHYGSRDVFVKTQSYPFQRQGS